MIAALIAAAALGQATPAPVEKVVQERDKVFYQKRTVIECGGTDVGGDRAEPGIAFYTARPARIFNSLIKLRVSFTDKLQTSTDNL